MREIKCLEFEFVENSENKELEMLDIWAQTLRIYESNLTQKSLDGAYLWFTKVLQDKAQELRDIELDNQLDNHNHNRRSIREVRYES